ncbi:MAG: 3-hydroxyacyl-CoA dehydrogenase family protein [Candidatus Eisenbacteria bacterium]|uniref:3-hydroxyacyl-CoA dehydrogenase family protein n=1 Tax=Eiseniibacteriota bacterium TaxID=2212470 RepID=A0A937XDR6_UNCEI|nr:3-hydroxyacyl-CoA dehydrogenase family protein [Candidatus Eisenbacteria bacterium]
MDLAERYGNVGVLGAAGKMGSGIALLLAQELGRRRLTPEGRGRRFKLTLMDIDDEALDGLKRYLRTQLLRYAEKSTGMLRQGYAARADLVENAEMIDAFIDETLDLARYTTDLGALAGCHMVFEAIAENIDLKVRIYRTLREQCGSETWFFTNTSSIPIGVLDREADLGGRLVGFHFYNPPAVQRLLEMITSPKTSPDLVAGARQITQDLGKKLFPANDVAGFIGNGHFMRDALHGIAETEKLAGAHGFAGAVYMVNRITQDWLVRPMGIFQLIDYVGIDVTQCILAVMNRFIPDEGLHSGLIDELMKRGVRGGQNSDGSQKEGFFGYEQGRIARVYDLERGAYRPLEASWTKPLDEALGALPAAHAPWKVLSRDRAKDAKLAAYFAELKGTRTLGAERALAYLQRSKAIGEQLARSGVAQSTADVNGVLINGFFHLYGPVNDYV